MKNNLKMEKPNVKEMQFLCNDILSYFQDFCKKNDIKFFLAYGTLLGAVRHKGFIPWDDDIDVIMTRKNFDKLCSAFQKRKGSRRYELLSLKTSKLYDLPLPKVIDTTTVLDQYLYEKKPYDLGAYIDVFIFDGVSDNKLFRFIQFKLIRILLMCWYLLNLKLNVRKKRSFIKYIMAIAIRPALKLIGSRNLCKAIDFVARFFNNGKNILGDQLTFCEREPERELMPLLWFENGKKVVFEGRVYDGPSHIHEYLSKNYGNYMELPPENQRVSNHTYLIGRRSKT